jgi:hypothetical protein
MGPYLLRDRVTAQRYHDLLETVLPKRCIFSCEAEVVVSARRSLSALWGCLAVIERDVSGKVDWALMSIAWSHRSLDLLWIIFPL